MQISTQHFERLAEIKRSTISTAEAAYHLGRAQQTMRAWAEVPSNS